MNHEHFKAQCRLFRGAVARDDIDEMHSLLAHSVPEIDVRSLGSWGDNVLTIAAGARSFRAMQWALQHGRLHDLLESWYVAVSTTI